MIEALKEVDGDRKCFRMVGGVLVERTVKEVLPAMSNNYEQVSRGHMNMMSLIHRISSISESITMLLRILAVLKPGNV